jgi:nucleotide-binding universal stress UspA family protein
MVLVVGYDRHPASRAALVFAGELAGVLNVPVHVVHVVDGPDPRDADLERQRVADALGGPDLQWIYHRMTGDPAQLLVKAADEHSAMMLVVGRPERGVEATLGHLVAGSVARNVLRHSRCPVLVVPEYGGGPR